MSKRRRHHRHRHDPEQRVGLYGGVYGTSYAISGGYLNPDQFGYTTAQSGDMTTTASGGTTSSGGDAGAGGGTA